MARNLLPPPVQFRQAREIYQWVLELVQNIQGDAEIPWATISKTDSDLADIESRLHSALQSIGEADDTSADTVKDKHVSNADMKAAADHRGASSAHGATGDIVGTDDYATASTGGTVLLSSAVTDASASSVSVDTADADATYGTEERDLINELKSDVNQLVTDVNAIKTTLNTLLANMRTAKQLDT